MKSGKEKFGNKLNNALLSPRFLRHRNVTSLVDDVFGSDSDPSFCENRKSTCRANSYSEIDKKFSSPSLARAAARIGKRMPRQGSLTSFLSAINLDKKNEQDRELYASTSSLKSKQPYENWLKTERHCLISSSESLTSEECDAHAVFLPSDISFEEIRCDDNCACVNQELVNISVMHA